MRPLFFALGICLLPQLSFCQTAVTTPGGSPPSLPVFTGNATVGPSNFYMNDYSHNIYANDPNYVGIGTSAPVAPLNLMAPLIDAAGTGARFGSGSFTLQALSQVRSASKGLAITFALPAASDGTDIYEQARIFASPDNGANANAAGRLTFQTRTFGDSTAPVWRNNLTLSSDGTTTFGGSAILPSVRFPDGTTQTTAFPSPDANGITPIVANAAGFQLSAGTQTIGGAFGNGGNMTFQANSLLDRDNTGGFVFLGGSARGDALRSKVWIGGNSVPGAPGSNIAGLLVNGSNNVGIGIAPTSDPASRLEVNGAITLSQNTGSHIVFQDGSSQSTAWTGTLPGGDYAESVDVTGDPSSYQAGDLLVIDPSSSGRFQKSSTPYSTLVGGVYALKPGVIGRRQPKAKPAGEEVPMAMVGIVPTKVTAENGPIHRGDLLVSSSTPGYAMHGTDPTRLTGAVVGKALGELTEGNGSIEVLISLQ